MSADVMHDDMLAAAQEYAQAGLAVVWLAPGTKRPMVKGWQDAPRATPEELEKTYRPGMNVGLRCGPVSLWGGAGSECLVVLDLDISTDDAGEQAAAWAAVHELIGHEKADAPSVVSGSGRGRHWYLRWPVSEIQAHDRARVVLAKSEATVAGSAKHAWQLEVLLAGAQVVANPSIHPDTGLVYEMAGPAHPAPAALVEAVRKQNNRAKLAQVSGGGGGGGGQAAGALAEFARMVVPSASMATGAAHEVDGEAEAVQTAAAQTAELMQELAGLSAFAGVGGPDDVPSLQRLREALAIIPPCLGRGEWTRVVWAVRAHGYPEGEQLAREWSEGCAEKWNPTDFGGVWRAQSRGPAVEAGTLYHIARQHGWAGKVRERAQPAAPSLSPEGVNAKPTAGPEGVPDGELVGVQEDGGGDALALGVVHLASGEVVPAGDLTNGVAFAQMWRGKLLYVSSAKRWMVWTGSRWTACETEHVRACARLAAEAILKGAMEAWKVNPNGATEKLRFAAASGLVRSEQRLEAMVSMARSEQGMWVGSPAVFDSDPWQLVCPNGVLDLRTGELSVAVPEMRISRQCAVPYEAAAQCPRFLRFMEEVFEGDREAIDFMQRQLGYCLTGEVSEEKMFYWFGGGANGKSVLGDVVARLMGEYAIQVSSVLLKRDLKGGNASEVHAARLAGVRLAQMNEIGEGEHWDDARLKELTSREQITAKELYAAPFSFMPTHKLVVRGNNKPIIRDTSAGTWRRMVLVGFNRMFQEHEREHNLDKWLVEHEGAGILAWLVDGCKKWHNMGLKLPSKVVQQTAAYKSDMDLFGQWIDECCDVSDPAAKAPKTAVRGSYDRWCEANGVRAPLTSAAITRKLTERGFRMAADKRTYTGFALRPHEWGAPAG